LCFHGPFDGLCYNLFGGCFFCWCFSCCHFLLSNKYVMHWVQWWVFWIF
jgi:hypothetical protein